MKKYGFIIFIIAITLGFKSNDTLAQGKGKGHAKVKTNGGGPPSWAPAHGYRAKTRHVLFKDYDVYYDLERSVYISLNAGTWEVTAKLPTKLAGVNLGGAVQIEIDVESDDPQRYYKQHKD